MRKGEKYMRYSYQMSDEQILAEIQEVRAHWQGLNCRLNEVSYPRVIEQLIYEMLADEKRYSYLLEMAKANDLHGSMPIIR